MAGATPVFVDVEPRHFQMAADAAERWITPRTRALMPVHLWGTVAPMEPLLELARRRGLAVIEDAAQAIGVRRNGRHAGAWGQLGAFSFFADKSLTTAEGGFVVTDDETIAERLEVLRNQGRRKAGSYVHPSVGYNLRITDIQAAIGLVQLAKLPETRRRKLDNLERYRSGLADVAEVACFEPPEGSEWIPFRVPLLCERAGPLMEHLRRYDIEPRSWFRPLHLQPCYAALASQQIGDAPPVEAFPNARRAHERGVLLPVFPTLREEQIEHVCRTIRGFYGRR
jgi:perosamine synthetase